MLKLNAVSVSYLPWNFEVMDKIAVLNVYNLIIRFVSILPLDTVY